MRIEASTRSQPLPLKRRRRRAPSKHAEQRPAPRAEATASALIRGRPAVTLHLQGFTIQKCGAPTPGRPAGGAAGPTLGSFKESVRGGARDPPLKPTADPVGRWGSLCGTSMGRKTAAKRILAFSSPTEVSSDHLVSVFQPERTRRMEQTECVTSSPICPGSELRAFRSGGDAVPRAVQHQHHTARPEID